MFKFDLRIYYLFVNSLLKKGEARSARSLLYSMFQNSRTSIFRHRHHHMFFLRALENLFTPVRIRRKKVAARIELVPSVINNKRTHLGFGVRRLLKIAKLHSKRNKFSLYQGVVEELGNAFEKRGEAYQDRKSLEWHVKINKKNVKYLRKKRAKSRTKLPQIKYKRLGRRDKHNARTFQKFFWHHRESQKTNKRKSERVFYR